MIPMILAGSSLTHCAAVSLPILASIDVPGMRHAAARVGKVLPSDPFAASSP